MGGPFMTVARALTAAVVFVGVALASASPASAQDPMAGIYNYSQQGEPAYEWTIYPTCVPAGCALHVSSTVPGYGTLSKYPGFSGDAKLVNDRWTLPVNIPEGLTCPDGSKKPLSELYMFDDKTLTGTRTSMHASVCGLQSSRSTQPFTLAYKSALPIPVELYPIGCPTWPNCNYDTVIPGTINAPPAPPA
jgi:hypothetical protein